MEQSKKYHVLIVEHLKNNIPANDDVVLKLDSLSEYNKGVLTSDKTAE